MNVDDSLNASTASGDFRASCSCAPFAGIGRAESVSQALVCTGAESDRPPFPLCATRVNIGWNTKGNIGLVVGATYPDEAREIRAICPDLPILMPGVGAQAGDLEAAVQAGIDGNGGNLIVNASRGVLYAKPVESADRPPWAEGARIAAIELRDAINAARGA